MSKYRIEIDGDPEGIKNAAKAAIDSLRGVQKASADAADVRTKEEKKAADAAEREAKRVTANAEREAKKAAAAQEREAKKAAEAVEREAKRAAAAQEREAKKAAEAQERASKKAADAAFVSFASVESAAIAHRQKLEEQATKLRQKQEAEAKKAFDASFVSLQSFESAAIAHRQKLDDLATKSRKKQEAEAKKAADSTANSMFGAFDATKQLADVVGSLAGQFTILNAAGMAFQAVTAYFRDIRNDVAESVKGLAEMRERTLELAALKGRLGQTTPEVKAQLAFRAQTLQSEQDAIRYQQSAMNTGASSIIDAKGNGVISQAEFDKLMMKGGRFQAAQGGDADALGAFFGQLPTAMKQKNVTADQAFGEASKIFNILDKGGSDLPVAVRQLSAGLGYTTSGIFDNVAQQASLQAAFSKLEPGKEQERTAQFTRATVGSLGRMRGSGVMVDEKQAEYLKRIGGTDQMNPIEIGKLIMGDWASQEKMEASRGRKFNPITYMQGKGYQNTEDINSLMQFSGLMKTGTWGTFEELSRQAPNAASADADIAKFQMTDPVAQERKAQLAGQAGTVARAAGPMEYYEKLKRVTFERKKTAGEYWGNYEDWQGGFGKEMLENATADAMQAEAKRVGVGTGWGESARMRPGMMANDRERAETYYGLSQRIGAAGGDTLPGVKELVGLATKQLESTERTEKLMERTAPPGPPPLQAKPKGLNPRP